MRRSLSFITCMLALLSAMVIGLPGTAHAQGDQQIYTDSLASGWQNWSWCATNFSSHDYVHGGAVSIKATITAAWQALYLHCDPTSGTQYSNLTFWINGGAVSGRNLEISGLINNTSQGNAALNQFISGGTVAANTWSKVTVPLSAIGLAKTSAMTGFWIGDASGGAQAAFYVDDITLVGVNSGGGPVTITIDANANRHPINPQVYGLAYASQANLTDLNLPLNRLGGNATTRYNWQQNASNHASDYYFESIAEASATSGDAVDAYITSGFNAQAQTMVTIPTIGWVANLGPNRGKTASFSRAKYGAQTSYDYWWPDAGNGIATSGQFITGNDANDANMPADSTFQQGWVKHIVNQYGQANKGGVTYYILDNEPSLWHSTHRDVHPTGATMDEIKGKVIDYAARIKAVDANAQIVGPEEWGWSGYFYSGYDQQYGGAYGWSSLPDRNNHGGADYMPWLLGQLHQYDTTNKTKSLDVFSLHYYPQGGEYGNDITTAMQLRRNRSTRSLWDPNYTDETWINDQVQLIPRMKKWVSDNYAGLKTALTEYNWGAEGHINGATTQADILGIFGREGLDMAARWTTPDSSTPTYKAFQMYRNVDGNNQGFGDISVLDSVPDPDTVSSFASVRSSDGALTVMLINKALSGSAQTTVNLANFVPGNTARAWQLTSTNSLSRLSDISVSKPTGGPTSVALTLPAQSITLVVALPVGSAPKPVSKINCGGGSTSPFAADQDYNGGQIYAFGNTVDLTGVTSPAPMTCYQSCRYSQNSPLVYSLPNFTPGASYKVRLHFVEPYYTTANQRLFNVSLNGSAVLSNFDVVAAAGAAFKAVIKEFTTTADANGNVTITLTGVKGDPFINALEVIPTLGYQINAGGSAVTPFSADQYSSGGQTYSTSNSIDMSSVSHPAPMGVYQSCRYGNLSYALPNLTPGISYTVRLHFAEPYYTTANQRLFNVSLNGNAVLSNFDVVAAAGAAFKAVSREFTVPADANGKITVAFNSVKGDPFICGLEIIAQ